MTAANKQLPYVRQYRTKHGDRWALFAWVDGRRRRVGTALTPAEYLTHLGFTGEDLERQMRCYEPRT